MAKSKEMVELEPNADGTYTNKATGEVCDETGKPIDVNEVLFGLASDVAKAHDDGGMTIRKIQLAEGKSIAGVFIGFAPYEYTDTRDKDKGVRVVVLSDVIIEVVHPQSLKPLGLIVKLGGTTRIIQDLALAEPGDIIKIARLGEKKINGNRMWDDVTRVYPKNPGNRKIAVSASPINTRKQLEEFRNGSGRALPASGTQRNTDDDRLDNVID
jgi:hypothetical protein